MAHWGWYWKVKLKHKPKRLCSHFMCLDSFELFRNKLGVQMSMNQVAYEIPKYKLKATLLSDRYDVEYDGGFYSIPIEKQPCNYGGFRYYLRCPKCNQRMRKLYCDQGVFNCRKCLNLGYYTQRLRPSERCLYMVVKVSKKLENMAGSLDRKPPWMKRRAFEGLKDRDDEYWEKRHDAVRKELIEWYPNKRAEIEMLF